MKYFYYLVCYTKTITITMMQAAFSTMEDYLQSEISEFCEDMSNYTLIEVLNSYQMFKRRSSPNYSIDSSISNIKKLEEKYNTTIKPRQVTSQFYSLFEQYLLEKGLAPSTINKYFDGISAALTYSAKYNCKLHPTYNLYDKSDYEKSKVALSADEVSHIYHFDLSHLHLRKDNQKTLEKVRDMFCLSCCVGQRYSDMIRIEPSMFDETGTILKLRQQKTNNPARIDIPRFAYDKKMALAILRKYNYYAPYTGDISRYEKRLKLLLQYIGCEFNETVRTEYKINGAIKVVEMPKWKCISSHTARRSFITYNIMRGKTETEVRECSGHKSSDAFSGYIVFGN